MVDRVEAVLLRRTKPEEDEHVMNMSAHSKGATLRRFVAES